jgi:hypothetical protein
MLGAARLTTKNLSPSYSVGLTPSTTNEGAAGGVINVTGRIYFNETSIGEFVYWEVVPVSGSITTNDFNQSSGTIALGYSTFTEFSIGVLGDSLTEGIESFYVRLRLTNASGPILAFSNTVTINDSSTNATYAFTAPSQFTNPNEGTSTVFTLVTTNVANGTVLPWAIRNIGNNTGITAADFTSNSLTGTVTINNNTGSFTLTYRNDNTFEGSEGYFVTLTNVPNIVSNNVFIQDTSDGGASLKVNPDAYSRGENLKLALPFRQSTQFNDISYTYYESTQNVAATRTGPIGVVISSSGQKFYDGAFIADGTQTPAQYVTTTALNTSGNFCIMFWAKTNSSNWNNWVLGNNASGLIGEMGISLSTYNQTPSPNGDLMRLIGYQYDTTLFTYREGDGAAGRIGGLVANQWYHFCFTKTGWWVNGQYKGTISWAGGSWNLRGGIVVGGAYNQSGGFVGGLQDFRVYVGNNIIQDYTSFTPPLQMVRT